jgi:3D (Asp-Asp-Asp) domain-containing protein
VILVRDGRSETLETRALSVNDLLLEEHIVRSSDDALDVAPDAPVTDGETIHYRAAATVTLVVDGIPQTIRTTAPTVGALLESQKIPFDAHDAVVPSAGAGLGPDQTVDVEHVSSWIERQDKSIAPPVHHVASLSLALGATKVVAAGLPGIRETSYLLVRNADRSAPPIRTIIASRVLRPARPRIIAAGIGEYQAFANLALRGFDGTIRLAKAAMAMVATAYTANCSGCSGITKLGLQAGHGIVAVDPSVIPLGTHLYIPGYGRAVAGDTGGSIHGNRIDLGFNSSSDAMQFGRRAVVVYLLHH